MRKLFYLFTMHTMQLEFFASMHVYEINVQYVRTSNFYSVITLNKEKNAPRIEYRASYQLDNIPSGLFLLPRSPTRCSRQALYKCTPLLPFLYKQPLDSWTTKYRDLLIPRGLSRALTVKLPSVYSLWYTPLALSRRDYCVAFYPIRDALSEIGGFNVLNNAVSSE